MLNISKESIDNILKLASDRSELARIELLNCIIDFFLSPDQRLTEQQRALMTDILAKLIGSLEMAVRRNIADSLIKNKIVIPELEAILANDNIEISRILLEKSNVLNDIDLIEIVKSRSDEHRLAIAIRNKISASVTDVLVEYGSEDVLEALIRNEDALLSRRAMEYLVSESKRVDRFQEPLLSRDDLPSDLAYQMYWWVSAALRRHILEHYTVDSELLDDCIEDATMQVCAEYQEEQGAQVRAQRLARRMLELGELTDSFLLSCLRQQRVTLFVSCVAERSHLSYKTCWHIVTDNGYESFVVLSKAIQMNRETMVNITLLLSEINNFKVAQKPDILVDIINLYNNLNKDNALKIVKLWQRHSEYQKAIKDIAPPQKSSM